MTDRPPIVTVVGPTASGKTGVAMAMATELKGEIVSADAVAVYRGFDIGSAKPTPDEVSQARHHIIDVVDAHEKFDAAAFVRLADQAITDIVERRRLPIVAGGTGLYVKALINGLFDAPPVDEKLRADLTAQTTKDPIALFTRLKEVDPETASRLDYRDTVRVVRAMEIFIQTGQPASTRRNSHAFAEKRYPALKLGLMVDRKILTKRIEYRTGLMIESGLIDEVKGLLKAGIDPASKPMQSIGYKQIVDCIQGKIDRSEAIRLIIRETKRLAKRQMTWFKADSDIIWLSTDDVSEFIKRTRAFIEEDR